MGVSYTIRFRISMIMVGSHATLYVESQPKGCLILPNFEISEHASDFVRPNLR